MFIIGLLLFTFAVGCQNQNPNNDSIPKNASEKKLNVVTTIGMITDIVKHVGGDKIDVTGIIGEGIDPHLYKPTAQDTKRLLNADIVFYNGLNLEIRITGTVLDKMKDKTKAVAVTDKVDTSKLRIATEFMGGYDPHVWHDVSIWMKATEKSERYIGKKRPEK